MKHPNLTVITLDPMANVTLRERFTQDDNENFSNILLNTYLISGVNTQDLKPAKISLK